MPRLFSSSISRHLLRVRAARLSAPVRLASSSSRGGGAGRLLAGTSLVVTGAVGGAVGYAAYDQEFRKSIEDLVPGSQDVLDALLGGKYVPLSPKPVVLSKQRTVSIDVPEQKEKVVEKPLKEVVEEPLKEVVEEPLVEVIVEPLTEPEIIQETPSKLEQVEEEVAEIVSEAIVAEIYEPQSEIAEAIIDEKISQLETEIPEPVSEIAEKNVETEIPAPVSENVVVEPIEAIDPIVLEEAEPSKAINHEELIVEEVEAVQPDEPVVKESDPKQMEAEIAAPISTAIHLENSSLSEDLQDLCKKMKAATEEAVDSNQMSSEAIAVHMKVMQKVLEADLTSRNEAAWNEVFEAATAKSKTARQAEAKGKEAHNSITAVIDLIRAGRSNKVTCANPALSFAEQLAEEALATIDQAQANINSIQAEAKILEEYRDIVEEGRQQFHQEMASIMPDVKLGEKGSQLSEDELNLFITHAYRKVLYLQQELAKQQTLEQQRFKQALDKQDMETRIMAVQKIESELERQRQEMETDHQLRIKTVREDMEKELRDQLRRQAAAHSDHLADVVSVQEMEMTRLHSSSLEAKMSQLSGQCDASLAEADGAVAGLASAIEARAEDDALALEAERLWLACAALSQAVKEGTAEAATWEERFKPLGKIISALTSASGGDEKFVSTVLASIPPVALERGVYTEDTLKERFVKVEKLAKRVALVGDDGGTLFKFGLSYLQSMLLVNTTERLPSSQDLDIDINQLSTQDIVCQARYCIDRGDFVMALQLMNQLRGEPRRVASDWLKETQYLLETQQAVEALTAHAAAVGVDALPQ